MFFDVRKIAVQALCLVFLTLPVVAYDARDYAVDASVSVTTSPPAIKLQWAASGFARQYTIRRKRLTDNTWSAPIATLPGNSIQFVDFNVTLGSAFEYEIEMETTLPSANPGPVVKAYSYLFAGVEAPVQDLKGKVIVVVDSSIAGAIAAELDQFEYNLVGAGWIPIRKFVGRSDPVINVRNLIRNEYNADPANVRSVILIGHVPVPYSGLIAPDFHTGHLGAWPADVFYGEMDGNWTDNSVWKTDSEYPANNNIPGDGKFDQSQIPSPVELEVGRIDFYQLPAFAPRSEVDLLRNYFRKNHNFRHRNFTLKRQGLVRDNFGDLDGDAPAVDAWRHYSGFFGFASSWEVGAGSFFPALDNDSFLVAYGGGGGGYDKADGVGTTDNFAASDPKSAFLILHGSYFGDWDNSDNFLRAAIATPNYTLASIWSGLPHWYMHHLGLGQTVGLSTRVTQNNQNRLYKSHLDFAAGQVHISLIGDPTLELFPVAPPSNLRANVGTGLILAWDSSPDPVAGYHMYYSQNPKGPFQRLSAALSEGTTFTQRSLASGTHYYMVRAVKLERTGSGTFYNPSQGIILTVVKDGTTPQLPVVQVNVEDSDCREEGAGVGSFRVSRSIVTSSPLVVDLQAGGTAANGTDYNLINDSVTIPAGVGTAFVTITPIPDALVEGSETVVIALKSSSTYTVGSSSSATLEIKDQVVNQPPTISAIADVSITEDSTAGPITFIIGDSGTPASALVVQASSSNTALVPTANLQLGGSAEGRTIKALPTPNAFGETTLIISVSDGSLSATRSFLLRVAPANDPPLATAQSIEVTEDTATPVTLSGDDIDSQNLSFAIVANPAKGKLTGTPPALTYTPSTNVSGADSFTFKVNDGQADSPVATVQIQIVPSNDPPAISALPDLFVAKNTAVGPLAFVVADIETAGAQLQVTGSSSNLTLLPNSSIVLAGTNENRTILLTPTTNLAGTTLVTIEVSDGAAKSSTQFSLTVTNRPPVAVDDSFEFSGTVLEIPVSILLANDSDPDNDPIAFSALVSPTSNGGTVVLNGDRLIYTPPSSGVEDTFTYRIEDASGATAAANVSIAIVRAPHIESLTLEPNGNVVLQIFGFPSARFEVSASSDGSSFTFLGDGKADAQGSAAFTDSSASNAPVRFYRVKWNR